MRGKGCIRIHSSEGKYVGRGRKGKGIAVTEGKEG